MKFSKNLKYIIIAALLSLTSSNQLTYAETEEIKKTAATFGHQYPFIPSVAATSGLFGITGCFKKTPFKGLAVFSLMTFTGTFFCKALSESYLKKKLSCFEWMKHTQQPSFTVQAEKFWQALKSKLS